MALRVRGTVRDSVACSCMVATIVLLSNMVNAYCRVPVVAEEWSKQSHGLEIPVYVSTQARTTVEHTGLPLGDFARAVIDAIARHNELVTAPKLHFAGFTDKEFLLGRNPVMLRPGGITVQSFDCSDQQMMTLCPWGAIGCAYSDVNSMMDRVATITLNPEQCNNVADFITWGIASNPGAGNRKDPIRVVLHEFGHALGLQHTNVTDNDCIGPQGGMPGPNPGPNEGTMRTVGPANYQSLRSWRRDDIEGFEALYGPYDDSLRAGPVWWADDAFPNVPDIAAGRELAATSSVAPVVSSSKWSELQVVAWLDTNHRVVRALVDEHGEVVSDEPIVDPSAAGHSWQMPTAAIGQHSGDFHEVVGWTSGETTEGVSVTPRWAVRELPDGEWSYFEGGEQTTARFQLGFDDLSEELVLARFNPDSEVVFSLVDLDGVLNDELTVETQISDIGAPACLDGVCAFPIASANVGGPRFGRIEVAVVDGLLEISGPSGEAGLDTLGKVDMAAGEPGLLRAVAGNQRFEVDGSDIAAPALPAPAPTFLDGHWPLSVGAFVVDGAIRHSLVSALAIECGNGVLQLDEACDDGNQMDGDGCDSHCMLELGGETGGGIDEQGNGCECSADGDGQTGPWGSLAFLGAVAMGLRRRSRR